MDDPRVEAIRQLAEPILEQEQAELVDLSVRSHGNQVTIRLLVDAVGGVTISRCTKINRQLGDALEIAVLIPESYTIEVCSPGLDRPLSSRRDYERAIGEDLDLQLTETAPGPKQLSGMLLSVQDQAIVLTTRSGNVTVPLDAIRLARKAIHF